MPNPTPRPYALDVFISTPPSGAYQNIAPYIGKQHSPSIRFNANGLAAETTLPLHFPGNLPYSLQEWANVQIQAIDTGEWIFNGYVTKRTSRRTGPINYVNLTCIDGNIKLRRGVGRTVDGGPNAIITNSHTWPAGTKDNVIVAYLLNTYLPDVSAVFVNNIFSIAEEFTIGWCTVYDALIALRKLAPSGTHIRFYVGFSQTSGLPWHLNWFDTNVIPVSNLVLSDDPYPGVDTSNYWKWERTRDGLPIYNKWYVVGKDPATGHPIIGSADDTTSQTDLGVILSGISVNNDLATVAACNAEATSILLNRGTARESITGLETHENLLLTGPQLIRVKNDLEPGYTTPTVLPVETTTLTYNGREPVYSVDLGDRFLALGEEDEGGNFGTRPTTDTTAPNVVAWLAEPPNPILNRYNPASNDVTLEVGWTPSTATDLLQYKLHRRRYTDNNPATPEAWDLGINIPAANTTFFANYPPGALIGHLIYAEDTSHNISGPSLVYDKLTVTDSIPQPTSVAIPAQGPFFTDGLAKETWAKITANLGGYANTPYTVHIKCISGNHILHFTFDDTQAQPWYCTGFRFGGYTYTVRVAIENRYGVLGPYSAVGVTFTTPGHVPRGGLDRGLVWEDVDFDGNIAGVSSISKGASTTYGIVSTSTDFGPKSLKATVAGAEYIYIELQPQSITNGKPLAWAFSVKANRVSPVGPPTGTYTYKIKWLDANLAVLNTQTVQGTALPATAQLAFWKQSGQVDAYGGAVAAQVRIEYSGNSSAEDVYFGLISLTDQVQAVNIQSRAVTARAQDLGVPYAIYNGEMEIPNLAGTLPDEYEVTGPSGGITYSTGSNRNLIVGSVAGTYVVRTPKILMGLYYAQPWIRTRWYQSAHASGIGTVVVLCLDANLASLGTVNLTTNGALTYSFQTGFTGVVECGIPTSLLPANTKYTQIQFTYVTTGNQPLTLDRFKAGEIDTLAALGYQFRGSAGNLINTIYSGNNAGRPTFVDQDFYLNYESLYIETNRVLAATNRRLSQPSHLQFHDYTAGPQPWATGGEKLVCALEGVLGHDLYLLQWSVTLFVGGTNNSTNYWNVELRSLNNSIGFDSHKIVSTSADPPNVWLPPKRTQTFTNNPVATAGRWLQIYTSAVGAPSSMYVINDLIVCEIL